MKLAISVYPNNSKSRPDFMSLIYYSLKPLYYFSTFCGLAPYKFENTNDSWSLKPNRYDLKYFIVWTFCYAVLISCTALSVINDDENYIFIDKLIVVIYITIMLSLLVVLVISSFIFKNIFIKTVNIITDIDEHFHTKQLCVSFKLLRKRNNALLTYMFASVIVRSCLVLQTIRIDLLQQLTMFFATLTKALVIYYFIAMVLQLNIRFNMVNSFIQKKSKTNKEDTMIVTDYIKPLKVEDDLYFLCRQHYRICNGARLLNWAFGLQILASVSVTLADILFQSYYLYHILFQKVPYLTALMILRPVTWLIDESIQTYLLVIACANLCDSVSTIY